MLRDEIRHVSKIVGNQRNDRLILADRRRHERVEVQQPVELQINRTARWLYTVKKITVYARIFCGEFSIF